jgi:hypothetical protein
LGGGAKSRFCAPIAGRRFAALALVSMFIATMPACIGGLPLRLARASAGGVYLYRTCRSTSSSAP